LRKISPNNILDLRILLIHYKWDRSTYIGVYYVRNYYRYIIDIMAARLFGSQIWKRFPKYRGADSYSAGYHRHSGYHPAALIDYLLPIRYFIGSMGISVTREVYGVFCGLSPQNTPTPTPYHGRSQ
jgi:hypothetical protein